LTRDRHQWLTSVILATQEAEIRKVMFSLTLYQKYSIQKRGGGVAQVVEILPSKLEALGVGGRGETPGLG
jgi:hypothetical protein